MGQGSKRADKKARGTSGDQLKRARRGAVKTSARTRTVELRNISRRARGRSVPPDALQRFQQALRAGRT